MSGIGDGDRGAREVAGSRRFGLTVHTAPRVEDLCAALVDRLRREPPDDPFTPIRIVVQSRGMQRWLSHQLAQHLAPDGGGVAANLAFPFPGKVLRELAQACLTEEPVEDPWQPDRLVWHVLAVLADARGHPQLARLDRYLGAEVEAGAAVVDRRTWRLARAVADAFDAYALARPRMVSAWSAGDDVGPDLAPLDAREAWQPWLWRQLVGRLATDPAARAREVLTALHDGTAGAALPAGLRSLRSFGISALPGAQLELLAALARHTPVELFVPTVSPARWEAIGTAVAAGQPRPAPTHPLLAANGRVGDDAAELVHRAGVRVTPIAAGQADEVPSGLLAALQDGLRRDHLPRPEERPTVAGSDRSVRIHRCYGPARQAEVLRDELLRLLADDDTLEPRDVLVMTPDIDTFAPLVQAAFLGSTGVPDLPVRVADRHLGVSNPVAEALQALLELAAGRATAAQVLDLLGRDPVARRFALTADLLEQAATWVADTGVHWGADRADRERHGQPPDRVHTWRFGLDRLLLGVAMADEDHRIVGDVAPYDHVEGDDAVTAGRLAAACRRLFATAAGLRAPRPLAVWCEDLTTAMEDCVDVEVGDRWRVQEVRDRLDALARDGRADDQPGDGLTLDLGAMRTVLARGLDQPRGAAGYETGAVTVCALIPMRSIPHRVVCLLGLDDGSFPRQQPRTGFDLLDRHDQVGDRDRRVEDRGLFLEAILAARQHLVVTTTGWDVHTGEDRPPAVPLAELRETLDRTVVCADGRSVSDAVTVDHPLHPFAPAAFDPDQPDGPRAFDPVAREAAELARRSDRSRAPLLVGALPAPASTSGSDAAGGPVVGADGVERGPDRGGDGAVPEVALRTLIAAVTHPTRHLLRDRLGVHLREDVAEVDDLEPVTLDPLRRSQLGRELLTVDAVPAWTAATLASGAVPAGTPGRAALTEVGDEVALLRSTVGALATELGLPADRDPLAGGDRRAIDLTVAGHRLAGEVDGLHPLGGTRTLRLVARFVRPNPEHLLEAWVTHLALTAAGATDLISAVVVRPRSGGTKPAQWQLGPLDTDPADPDERARVAAATLADLLEVHRAAERRLLPLFPRASHRFAQTGRIAAARGAFAPEFQRAGDGDRDEYVREAYGEDVTLDELLADHDTRRAFVDLAERVWRPAVVHADAFDLDALVGS